MNNLGKNKKLLLAKYPDGLAELDDFITEEVDVPEIGENEILIPASLGAIGFGLEKIGIKGVNNYINALTLNAKKRTLSAHIEEGYAIFS